MEPSSNLSAKSLSRLCEYDRGTTIARKHRKGVCCEAYGHQSSLPSGVHEAAHRRPWHAVRFERARLFLTLCARAACICGGRDARFNRRIGPCTDGGAAGFGIQQRRCDNSGDRWWSIFRSPEFRQYISQTPFSHVPNTARPFRSLGMVRRLAWTLQDEEFNLHEYPDPIESQLSLERFRYTYNFVRPHQALRYRVPAALYCNKQLRNQQSSSAAVQ
jgi:hypothetical protein